MTDYKSAHLAWINSTKSFTPKYLHDYTSPYVEIMKFIYAKECCSQEYARKLFIADKVWFKECHSVSKDLDKAVCDLIPAKSNYYFVTIGFNHQTWTISECVKSIHKILAMEWIISGKANFELYRTNGEHPHCHFVIETLEPKSRILEKLFRPQYMKKIILSKNFIDVKPMENYHHKYIMLDKVSDKMFCVEKDIQWRKENNIPDFEKNYNFC